jgi:hypothetical protein
MLFIRTLSHVTVHISQIIELQDPHQSRVFALAADAS